MSGEDNYGDIIINLFDACEQLETANVRQAQIEQNQFRSILSYYREGLRASLRFEHTIAFAFEQAAKTEAD